MFKKTILCYDVSTLPFGKSIEDVKNEMENKNLCTYNSTSDYPGNRQHPYAIQISITFKEWLKSIFK